MGAPRGGGRRGRRRVITERVGTGYIARRPPILPRSLVWGFAILVTLAAWVGMAASRQSDPQAALATLPAAPAPAEVALGADGVPGRPGVADRASRSDGSMAPAGTAAVFANVHGLSLQLPYPSPIAIAFHEATRPEALALDPVGRLLGNDNPTKFSPGEDAPGPEYRVLSSRGRPRPATSAVDIVLPDGSLAAAPVSGEVVEVREYALYGTLRDWRVVIEPDGHPDLHVVLIHLHEPRVRVGDRVEGGRSPVAVVRLLPMASHVDTHTEGSHPHLHLEVKPAVGTEPLDPNEPAVMPDQDPDAHVVRR